MLASTVPSAAFLGSLLLFVLVGCADRPSRVKPPSIDPDEAGQQAIEQYDGNADGVLSFEELRHCPAVKRAIGLYDDNRDQSVSVDEITQRIRTWQNSKLGLLSLGCTVKFNGSPLEGATVEFIPENYLGEAVKPASGTTDASGWAPIAIADADLPDDQKGLVGVHVGVYKVQVTHAETAIPRKYNAETTLGQEVAQDNPDTMDNSVSFDLRF